RASRRRVCSPSIRRERCSVRVVDLGLAAAFVVIAANARADDESARAETLFVRGRSLLAARRVAEACDVLAESAKLDRAVGTPGLLASCHEEQVHIATAHAEYLEAAVRCSQLHGDRSTFLQKKTH